MKHLSSSATSNYHHLRSQYLSLICMSMMSITSISIMKSILGTTTIMTPIIRLAGKDVDQHHILVHNGLLKLGRGD